MTAFVDAPWLRQALEQPNELALIDVREQGVYSLAHLLFAVCIPVSHLEMRMPRLAPRRSVDIVLCDGGEDGHALAQRAATRLAQLGYSHLRILGGGPEQWRQAGLEVYSGVNVPSKAFGEFVEHWYNTPRLPAADVAAMQARGEKFVILDSRPMPEFSRMSIPGGVDCPGAELVYRVHEMAPDSDTTIVVNCAGRTRSIIGAQSLINAGLPNNVFALKDGTMGWQLAGLQVERGRTEHAPEPGERALELARERAAAVADRFDVKRADPQMLAEWLADDDRTTMLLDVRTQAEFEAGHWPGAQHAPGGQLVQATDEYVATRGARLVLLDSPDAVRATMTAHWLIQLGWPEVWVLADQAPTPQLGAWSAPVPGFVPQPTISVSELKQLLATKQSVAVIDLASSLRFRAGHIAGASWAIRSRITDCLKALPPCDRLVITAPEESLAHLAASDLDEQGLAMPVAVLSGGTAAWERAGGQMQSGLDSVLTSVDDVWFKPYDHQGEPHDAMQAYLTWEVGLVDQVNREGLTRFRRFD